MAATVDITSAFQALPGRKERLHKAFAELDCKKSSLNKFVATWEDVDEYVKEVEKGLLRLLEECNAKEKALEAKMKDGQVALEKRDADVSAKEQASLARVQVQKDSAIAAILEQKRKWSEERQRLEVVAGGVSDSVAAKKKPMDLDVKVALGGSGNPALDNALSGLLAKDTGAKDRAAASKLDVKPRPELKSLCETMNSEGLRKFIAEHRKDLNALSAELPSALKCANDPALVVLKALDGYHPSESSANQGVKDSHLPANRRACVILLEALSEVLADPILGIEHPVVSVHLRNSAKQFADLWKSKMNLDGDLGSNFSLDAQSFLQLLATFGLASDYDQDEICKLIAPIARRKQTPALCRALGLSAKMPAVIEKLINDDRQIEAVSFASAFELFDRFPPVPLLKTYLKEARKAAQATLKSGNNSAAAQNEANQKELSVLKAVLRSISEYKLEDQYPPAPLERRVAQLEKAKADKKRAAFEAKTQQLPKRARRISTVSVGSSGGLGGAGPEKSFFRPSDNAQYGGVGASAYGAVAQPSFERHPVGGYSSGYGGGSRSPVSMSSAYLYSGDGLSSLGYGSSAFVNPASSYGGYSYGSGLGTGPSGYHQSYLH